MLVLALSTLAAGTTSAQSGKVEVLWLGQAAFKITTVSGKVIVIDPFLTQNPKTPPQWKNLDALGKVDLILVTHAHGDHIGDAPELAKKTNAPVYAPAGFNQTLVALGLLPANLSPRMNKGGTITPLGPDIKITMTRAEHSSEFAWKNPATGKDEVHVGKPDLLLIPIGGHFVMSPQDAAVATRDLIKPKFAVPMHYGTFPPLKGTPQEYMQARGTTSTKLFPINPGDKLEF